MTVESLGLEQTDRKGNCRANSYNKQSMLGDDLHRNYKFSLLQARFQPTMERFEGLWTIHGMLLCICSIDPMLALRSSHNYFSNGLNFQECRIHLKSHRRLRSVQPADDCVNTSASGVRMHVIDM